MMNPVRSIGRPTVIIKASDRTQNTGNKLIGTLGKKLKIIHFIEMYFLNKIINQIRLNAIFRFDLQQ